MGESPILAELVIAQSGKGVQVEFTKIEGVISHTISLVNAGEKTPVLISRTSELAQPCFTELHQQGDLLFLTGANGACHWSMSVQKGDASFADVANPARETLQLFEQRFGLNAPVHSDAWFSGQFLHFDIACRIKEAVPDLCSQYLAQDNFGCCRAIQTCCAMDVSDMNRGMVLLGGPKDKMTFSPEPNYSIDCISEREIVFSPVDTTATSFPSTLRWSYGVWRA